MNINNQYDVGNRSKEYISGSLETENSDLGRIFLKKEIDKLDRSSHLLDVGCGNGLDLKAYKEMGFSNLYGVDPSDNFINDAKKTLKDEVTLSKGTFEQLPFTDNSFDIIVSRFAMHYSKDLISSIKEVSRVLKVRGKFIVVISHPSFDTLQPKDTDGNITITLFNKKVSITFPQHTLSEIFSSEFLKLFELEMLYEYNGEERDENPYKIPTALCFVAIKR